MSESGSSWTHGQALAAQWPSLRRLVARSFRGQLHVAVASSNNDGRPHVTPIGSLLLREPGHAVFFQQLTRALPRNVECNPEICILAVDSSPWLWLRALISGRFPRPPAVRLVGRVVGHVREPTASERSAWQRRVRWLRWFVGYRLLWGRMNRVRDVEIYEVVPVHLGAMT